MQGVPRLALVASAAVAAASLLAGCSSQSSTAASEPPAGPVNYPLASARLRSPPSSQPTGAAGSAETAAADGEVLSFVPDASTAFGAVKAVAGMISSYKTASQIKELTQEVAQLQAAVSQIEQELNLADNVFYQYVQTNAAEDVNFWIFTYGKSLGAISGSDGAYQVFLGKLGLPSTGVWPAGTTYQSLATPSTIDSLASWSGANVTQYMQILQDLSSAVVPVNCSDCYRLVKPATYTSESATGAATSATIQLYASLYQQLQAAMPQNQGQATTNLPTLMEAYNQEIMSIYQQNLAALQEAFTIESTESYLNYVAGQGFVPTTAQPAPAQIPSGEASPSLIYTWGGGSTQVEQERLTTAQEQLAWLYAARINTLFQTTMSYIVSDQPFTDFAWPTPPTFTNSATSSFTAAQLADINAYVAQHPYASFVKLNRPARTMTGLIGQVIPQVGQNWSILYQYDGLNPIYQCENQIFLTGAAPTETTCPPLFPSSTGAVWDGISYAVYWDDAGSPALSNLLEMWSCTAWTGPVTLVLGTSASGTPTGAILPIFPNPEFLLAGAASPAVTNDPYSNTITFTFSTPVTNLLPGRKNDWFDPYSSTGQTINTEPAGPIANQFITAAGYVGVFFLEMTYVPGRPESISLACNMTDPLCWAMPAGLCMGNNYVTLQCPSASNCSISIVGSCP